MSINVYCAYHNQIHTLDSGTAAALIYTYQRTLAEVAFEAPLAPVEPFANEIQLLHTFCPRDDRTKLETPKVRQYRRTMGLHRRRLSAMPKKAREKLRKVVKPA